MGLLSFHWSFRFHVFMYLLRHDWWCRCAAHGAILLSSQRLAFSFLCVAHCHDVASTHSAHLGELQHNNTGHPVLGEWNFRAFFAWQPTANATIMTETTKMQWNKIEITTVKHHKRKLGTARKRAIWKPLLSMHRENKNTKDYLINELLDTAPPIYILFDICVAQQKY